MKTGIPIIMVFYLFGLNLVRAQTVGFRGQLSSWITTQPEKSFRSQIGARYIPELSISKTFNDKYTLDGEFSANIYGYGLLDPDENNTWDGDISPYRLWIRFSASRYEVRAGLQKINFGPAAMLRPLMWFDQIDPRDPLQLTEGVYGILGRYYFMNNANIWLWILYGNSNPKGWEVFPSFSDRPEVGGRIQVPAFTGEAGLSFNHRVANLTLLDTIPIPLDKTYAHENKVGIDGKWDLGVGLWFEGSFIHMDIDRPELRSKKIINVGMDYTFGLGNGLNVMGEHIWFHTSEKFFSDGQNISFTALSLRYPLGLFHNLNAIFYYDWDNNALYNFINWGMVWDKISLYLIGYWNPENYELYQTLADVETLYSGRGFQLQFVFNH
jgi:hypothetical protein